MAEGFFKYKDDARHWIKDEKESRKNQKRSSSQDKGRDLSFWTLAQKYLADCKINYDKKTVGEKGYQVCRNLETTLFWEQKNTCLLSRAFYFVVSIESLGAFCGFLRL